MTLRVACGAECGIVTSGLGGATVRHWSSLAGAPAIGATVLNGSRSFSFAAAATVPWLSRTFPASQTVGYFRGYLRATDATPSSNITLVQMDYGATNNGQITLTTGGVLRVDFSNADAQNGPTLSDNTWYGIEAEFDVTANPRIIRWRTWDATTGWTARTNATNANAADTISAGLFGIIAGPTSGTTIFMDDILIGSGTVVGEDYSTTIPKGGKVLRLLPNADGTHNFTNNDFADGAAGSGFANTATDMWTRLDDSDQTSIADGFIRQAVAGQNKRFQIAFAGQTTESAPRAVAITGTFHSAGTGANEHHLRVSDDGSNWTNVLGNWATTGEDISDTSAHFRHVVLETKPSGGAWTAAAIETMLAEWGNSDDVNAIPYIDSVSLEVEWGHPRPDAPNAAGTGAAGVPGRTIKVNTAAGAGTGAAYNATVTVAQGTSADAEHAAGTGIARAATTSVKASTARASATGAAAAPGRTIKVTPTHASGTGASQDATVSVLTGTAATAEHAAGTGIARVASTSVKTSAAHAAATGVGRQPTTSVKASAGTSAGTAIARTAAASVKPSAGAATATGIGRQPTTSVKPSAGVVATTGIARTAAASVAPHSGAGAATGAAGTANKNIQPRPQAASVTAEAVSPAVVALSSQAPPGVMDIDALYARIVAVERSAVLEVSVVPNLVTMTERAADISVAIRRATLEVELV